MGDFYMKLLDKIKSVARKFGMCIVVFGLSIVLIIGFKGHSDRANMAEIATQVAQNEVKMQQIVNKKDIEQARKVLKETQIKHANAFINTVTSNDTQLILTTVHGDYNSLYQRKGEDDIIIFNQSTVNMVNTFTCKLGIYTSDLSLVADKEGNVTIKYSPSAIQVVSTEIDNTTYSDDKQLFGRAYSKKEMIAMIENNSEQIKESISTNQDYIASADKALRTYYTDLANKMGVKSVTFDNGSTINTSITLPSPSYTFKDCTTVKYGHNGEQLNKDDVEYIILHGTGLESIGVSAEQHITWLNNPNASDQCACHFYVDDDSVIQALPLSVVSWNAGKDYNDKSISIEICTYSNKDEQLQSISNAKQLLAVIQEMHPNAKVVTHHQVSSWGKPCPSFVYDSNTSIMSEEELMNTILDK